MKLIIILFGVVFCLVAVNGRHVHESDSEEQEKFEDSLKEIKEQSSSQSRHRRRSRQPYFDYNYSPYQDYRRENSRQEEIYSDILKLLEEMSTIIRHPLPPPPPQPIYIPYPVPYPVPQFLPCRSNKPTGNSTAGSVPDFFVRWPEMDDALQNWGLIPGDVGANDDANNDGSRPIFSNPNISSKPVKEDQPADENSNDGRRPISFKPILPTGPVKEAPPVEHGSSQAGMETSTRASSRKPGVCQAAILTCCNLNSSRLERQSCFEKYGCRKTFSTGLSCRPDVIKAVLEEYAKVYAPTNEP